MVLWDTVKSVALPVAASLGVDRGSSEVVDLTRAQWRKASNSNSNGGGGGIESPTTCAMSRPSVTARIRTGRRLTSRLPTGRASRPASKPYGVTWPDDCADLRDQIVRWIWRHDNPSAASPPESAEKPPSKRPPSRQDGSTGYCGNDQASILLSLCRLTEGTGYGYPCVRSIPSDGRAPGASR